MKRVLLIGLLVLCAAVLLMAQGGAPLPYTPGTLAVSITAATATTPNPQAFYVSGDQAVNNFTWTSAIAGGTASAITINLEGSIDYNVANPGAAHWIVLDQSTNTSGEGRSVFGKPAKYFRCNLITFTANGTTETCSIVAIQT
jgi:hypothetical protein